MAAQAVKADVTCGRADVTSMAKKAPRQGVLEAELTVGGPDTRSVGLPAVVQTLRIAGHIQEHFRCTGLRPWVGPVIPQPWFQAERIPS